MRTAESVATSCSPAFLCYGREMRTVWEPKQDTQDPAPPESTVHAFNAELTRRMTKAL